LNSFRYSCIHWPLFSISYDGPTGGGGLFEFGHISHQNSSAGERNFSISRHYSMPRCYSLVVKSLLDRCPLLWSEYHL